MKPHISRHGDYWRVAPSRHHWAGELFLHLWQAAARCGAAVKFRWGEQNPDRMLAMAKPMRSPE